MKALLPFQDTQIRSLPNKDSDNHGILPSSIPHQIATLQSYLDQASVTLWAWRHTTSFVDVHRDNGPLAFHNFSDQNQLKISDDLTTCDPQRWKLLYNLLDTSQLLYKSIDDSMNKIETNDTSETAIEMISTTCSSSTTTGDNAASLTFVSEDAPKIAAVDNTDTHTIANQKIRVFVGTGNGSSDRDKLEDMDLSKGQLHFNDVPHPSLFYQEPSSRVALIQELKTRVEHINTDEEDNQNANNSKVDLSVSDKHHRSEYYPVFLGAEGRLLSDLKAILGKSNSDYTRP